MKLFAPESYWQTPPHILDEITGGCGPGGFGDYLVPDNIDWPWPWGLSIFPACRIHDYMYHIGETREEKVTADIVFLNNMVRIVENANGWRIIKHRRLKRAWIYYKAVDRFGGVAYWKDKNSDEEEQAINT